MLRNKKESGGGGGGEKGFSLNERKIMGEESRVPYLDCKNLEEHLNLPLLSIGL